MTDPIPELPDDTPIESVKFPKRIRKALSVAGLKTIGEVREMSDGELLKMPGGKRLTGPGVVSRGELRWIS